MGNYVPTWLGGEEAPDSDDEDARAGGVLPRVASAVRRRQQADGSDDRLGGSNAEDYGEDIEEFDKEDARSIVLAAVMENLSDTDVDNLIEAYEKEFGKTPEIEDLEETITAMAEHAMPVKDIIAENPDLEFDLRALSALELATLYQEHVDDLQGVGSDVIEREVTLEDVEYIISKQPAPFTSSDASNEYERFSEMQWKRFNVCLRSTLLLLAYQHCTLDTAGAVLRLVRYLFKLNCDEDVAWEELNRFMRFAQVVVYSNEAATAQQVDEMLGYDRQADDESQDDMIPFEELGDEQQEGSDDVISASAVAGVAQTSGEKKVDQQSSATGSAVHPKEVVLASSS